MTGTIKKKMDRGFGFIAVEGQDKDLFFHSSALSGVTFDELSEGAAVSFEMGQGPDGRPSAQNVTLSDGTAAPSAPEEEKAPEETPAEDAGSPMEPAEEVKTSEEE